jgi:hypothetical protein
MHSEFLEWARICERMHRWNVLEVRRHPWRLLFSWRGSTPTLCAFKQTSNSNTNLYTHTKAYTYTNAYTYTRTNPNPNTVTSFHTIRKETWTPFLFRSLVFVV